MAILSGLIDIDPRSSFSQETTSPGSVIVQNYSTVVPFTSTGGDQERYEVKTNNIVVLPESTKTIQLSNVAADTEYKANVTLNEKPIYGNTIDKDSPSKNIVVNPIQTLLEATS